MDRQSCAQRPLAFAEKAKRSVAMGLHSKVALTNEMVSHAD